jgi:membrane-anchored mycosin MYCP
MPTARTIAARMAALITARVIAATAIAAALILAPGAGVAAAAPLPVASPACGTLPSTGLDHTVPWAQQQLGLPQVWPVTKGLGVTVAVIDTGVDARQPFLAGAVLPGVDVINGGGPANTDCDGHGTFVAGIIAGRQLPGFGFSGVAPQATILPIRQANSTSDGTADSLARGIIDAVNSRAQVINISIVAANPTLDLAQAVQYALARDVVVVAAAGNDFSEGNGIQYPAGFPGVLAVGAVDAGGQRANFSETGPNIGVVAPGTNLLGPGAGGQGLVTAAGGTSFATPFVAGVAALVRAYHPQLTAAQVISRIEATADHPPGRLPSPGLGWGEVNPYAAVTAVLPAEQGGGGAAAAAARVPPPPSAAPGAGRAATQAAALGAAAIALTAVVLLSAVVGRRGRRRRWRPGASAADAAHADPREKEVGTAHAGSTRPAVAGARSARGGVAGPG